MTTTYTTEYTFTRTNAKYIASKVAADLKLMQIFYGKPSDGDINDYIEELVILLLGNGVHGYLESVDYGFRKDGSWVVAAKYSANYSGDVSRDDRSGGIPFDKDITGAFWYSYLRKNSHFGNLSQDEKNRILEAIPIKRSGAEEPQLGAGEWVSERTYSSAGVAMERRVFKSY